MSAKPQCQFAEDSTELPRCERESTRKWGDHWFCEVYGGREKPAVPACPVCRDNLVIDRPNYPEPPRYGNCPRCIADGTRTTQMEDPDPVPALIAELLAFEGLAPGTRTLIELALEAQKSGTMPDLSPIKCAGCQGLGVVGNYEQTDPCPFCQEGGAQ